MLPLEIENRLKEIRGQVEGLGAELVEIIFRRAGHRSFLTIVADKEGGITLEDCVKINQRLGLYFEEISQKESLGSSFFKEPYFLEVNSPGLDRPLKTQKDFKRALGETVRVVFKDEAGRVQVQIGRVLSVSESAVGLGDSNGGGRIEIPLGFITKAVREIKF